MKKPADVKKNDISRPKRKAHLQDDYTQRTIDFLNDNNLPINAEKLETFLAKEKRNIVLEIEKQTKAIEELNKKLATFK